MAAGRQTSSDGQSRATISGRETSVRSPACPPQRPVLHRLFAFFFPHTVLHYQQDTTLHLRRRHDRLSGHTSLHTKSPRTTSGANRQKKSRQHAALLKSRLDEDDDMGGPPFQVEGGWVVGRFVCPDRRSYRCRRRYTVGLCGGRRKRRGGEGPASMFPFAPTVCLLGFSCPHPVTTPPALPALSS